MTRHLVVRTFDRTDEPTVQGLAALGSSTVHEADGRRGCLDPAIRPIQSGVALAGPAVTVSCHPGDNLMIHAAVETCRPGDVVVVTTTSPSTDGMLGELLATSLRARGVAAVITDAGVRDVAQLRQMGFPVWTRAISPQGTVKASPGSVNVPVVCGGQVVHPGDAIVADDDGVVVIPRLRAGAVLAAGRAREAAEVSKRARLAAGELGVDLYDLRGLMASLGITHVDSVPPTPDRLS
jgi:4-hydroxy-4-methyl-2-oxoglutarate aldolase